jgi:hypothetical protein
MDSRTDAGSQCSKLQETGAGQTSAGPSFGRIPNIPGEMGIRSAWRHDRQALIKKTAVTVAVSALAVAALQQRRRHRAEQRRLSGASH